MDVLADEMSFLLERVAPEAFSNLTSFSESAQFCRIGKRCDLKRPFSGVTSVLDFCAHAHHDRNNMNAGCTLVRERASVTCTFLIYSYIHYKAIYFKVLGL